VSPVDSRDAASAILRLRSPVDVLAAVPYLLGFHPADSVVVLGLRARRLVFHVRGDLPAADASPEQVEADARYVAEVLGRQPVSTVLVVGYGSADRATPMLYALRDMLLAKRIAITEMLRAAGGRYWSYVCASAECCPPEGTPYDVSGSRIAAEATFAGRVALPDRQALERLLGPPEGNRLVAIERATDRAEQRMSALLDRVSDADAASELLLSTGNRAVSRAIARHAAGSRLTDDEVAELSLLLAAVGVRDGAWTRISPANADHDLHVRLWTDVVSRAFPDHVAPAASLLAYAAWRAGDGVIAAIAVDRALAADESYGMAQLMAEVLHHAISPSMADGMGPARARRARHRRPRVAP
jgi:hypothetical protein